MTTSPFVRVAQLVEDAAFLDAPAAALAPVADALVADPTRKAALQGEWLGHALHPLTVYLPIGSWTGALLLDLAGPVESRAAAQRLVALGILSALPSAVTGLAEWADTGTRDRRTGVVHVAANSVALVCFTRSWLARRRGDHAKGRRQALWGAAAAGAGGFFGSHLAQARKVSSRHPAFDD